MTLFKVNHSCNSNQPGYHILFIYKLQSLFNRHITVELFIYEVWNLLVNPTHYSLLLDSVSNRYYSLFHPYIFRSEIVGAPTRSISCTIFSCSPLALTPLCCNLHFCFTTYPSMRLLSILPRFPFALHLSPWLCPCNRSFGQ